MPHKTAMDFWWDTWWWGAARWSCQASSWIERAASNGALAPEPAARHRGWTRVSTDGRTAAERLRSPRATRVDPRCNFWSKCTNCKFWKNCTDQRIYFFPIRKQRNFSVSNFRWLNHKNRHSNKNGTKCHGYHNFNKQFLKQQLLKRLLCLCSGPCIQKKNQWFQ